MKYDSFKYLFPPRPKHKIKSTSLPQYDNGSYYGQVKANGSNSTLYISPDGKWTLYNRHGEKQTLYRDLQFEKLHRGNGFVVISGEYLNKNKKHENGKDFNHKFIIFDILVYENEILDGTTLQQRVELLDKLYPTDPMGIITETGVMGNPDEYISQTTVPEIYKVNNFFGNFEKIYNEATKLDVYEGLVIKRKNAVLQPLFREGNNADWMLKARKETKNYKF